MKKLLRTAALLAASLLVGALAQVVYADCDQYCTCVQCPSGQWCSAPDWVCSGEECPAGVHVGKCFLCMGGCSADPEHTICVVGLCLYGEECPN